LVEPARETKKAKEHLWTFVASIIRRGAAAGAEAAAAAQASMGGTLHRDA